MQSNLFDRLKQKITRTTKTKRKKKALRAEVGRTRGRKSWSSRGSRESRPKPENI